MTRDYKHRSKRYKKNSIAIWKWLVVGCLLALFVGFLNLLREPDKTVSTSSTTNEPEKSVKQGKKAPDFQFYTILEKEQKIPDYEIKMRKREEQLGRLKAGNYVLQAGSFRHFKEADKRKAQLALLGFEAQIEKTKIDGTLWNRIKIGPYTDMNSVDRVRSRLRENDIDVVVMKIDR